MNNNQLFELLKIDPYQVPGEVEFWALYAKSFYEDLFSKISDLNKLEHIYNSLNKNPKYSKRTKAALEFFYAIRIAELEDPNFWDKVGMKKMSENMKAKLVKESLNESMSRHCDIYKAQDGKWYLELADNEYGEWDEANTYGPFNSEEKTDDYLSNNFSNPGGMGVDDSGERPVPTKSPNGSRVQRPGGGRFDTMRGMGFR